MNETVGQFGPCLFSTGVLWHTANITPELIQFGVKVHLRQENVLRDDVALWSSAGVSETSLERFFAVCIGMMSPL